MTHTQIKRLRDKYLPLFLGFFLFSSVAFGQTYNSSVCCTVSNKSYGPAQSVSTDGRSWFYDATNFVMRDYNGTTEVFSYLNLAKYRSGHFPVFVHSGGILQGNGVWLGGITLVYWFKDSTGNANLVRWYTDSTSGCTSCLQIANNLSDLANATTARTNIGLGNVNNTSDAAKNAAAVSLTNHTIDGSLNTLSNIPNSALTHNTIGVTLTATGSDISIPVTPAALGSSVTINIPTSTASVRGALLGSDWSSFHLKVDSTSQSNDTVYDWHNGTAVFRYVQAGAGTGISSLNGLTASTQLFQTGTAGSDFNIVSAVGTHTFNIPVSDPSHTGKLSNTDWSTFNAKEPAVTPSNTIDQYWNGYKQFVTLNSDSISEGSNHLFFTNARARAAISLTTSGTTGSATYNNSTGVLNVPNYSGGGGSAITQLTGDVFAGPGTGSQVDTVKKIQSIPWDTTGTAASKIYPVAYNYLSKSYKVKPVEETIGIIYNKNSWTSGTLAADFTNNGSTVSVVANKLSFSGGGGTYTQTLDLNGPWTLAHWRVLAKVKVAVTSGGSSFGVGTRSVNSQGGFHSVIGRTQTNTGGTNGNIYLDNVDISTATNLETINAGYSATDGGYVVIVVERDMYQVTVSVRDYTNNTLYSTATYPYVDAGATALLPNAGTFSIYSFGGTFTVDSLVVSSSETRNANLLVLGDSKSVGYEASIFQNSYSFQLGGKYSPITIWAGGGDCSTDIINEFSTLKQMTPRQVVVSPFSNDTREGALTNAQSDSNFAKIYDSLTSWGWDVFVMQPFYETSLDLTFQNTFVLSGRFPANKIIDTWDPMIWAGSLYPDGVHPGDLGHKRLYNAILNSGLVSQSSNTNEFFNAYAGAPPFIPVFNSTGGLSNSLLTSQLISTTPVVQVAGQFWLTGPDNSLLFESRADNVQSWAATSNNRELTIVNAVNGTIPLILPGAGALGSVWIKNGQGGANYPAFITADAGGRGWLVLDPSGDPANIATNGLTGSTNSTYGAINSYSDVNAGTSHLLGLQTTGGNVAVGSLTDNGYTLHVTGTADISDSVELENVRNGITADSVAVLHQLSAGKFVVHKVAQSSLSSGVTTIGTFSPTSIANGASISGTTQTLGVGDGTNPGMISTTTQTIAGNKILTGLLDVGGSSASTGPRLEIEGNNTSSVVTGAGRGFWLGLAQGLTNTATNSGTNAGAASAFFGDNTFASTNSGTVYTDAASLWINGAPSAGTNVTLTHPWSLYVASGNSGFNGNVSTSGNAVVTSTHFIGNVSSGIAAGTGAGTAPTVSISGTDNDGSVTILSGTTPTGAGATIATITYGFAFPANSFVTLTPANAITAALNGIGMVFTTASNTAWTITAGTTALTGATTYKWFYHVGGN